MPVFGLHVCVVYVVAAFLATASSAAVVPEDALTDFQVSATAGWVSTGIALQPGDRFALLAAGLAAESQAGWDGGGRTPDGDGGECGTCIAPLPASRYALVGRIGSQLILVGSSFEGTAIDAGTLELGFNDDFHGDNLGSYVVSSTAVGFCGASPNLNCAAVDRGRLKITETTPGREKLLLYLHGFEAARVASDFGDPVSGDTRYDLCLYDSSGALVEDLPVDRAGDECGGAACWFQIGNTEEEDLLNLGWVFRNDTGEDAGIRYLRIHAGEQGRGAIRLKAGNDTRRGQSSMPTGLCAQFAGEAATVQIVNDDGMCIGTELEAVTRSSDGVRFKASHR